MATTTLDPLRALLWRGDYAGAEAEVRALLELPGFAGEALQVLAREVEEVGAELVESHRDAAVWAYDRAITLWHGWGAMATSGGDGAARMLHINDAKRRRAVLLGR